MSVHVTCEQLASLQSRADRVHNVCIVAHVDHGKTTLADALIASNGIISPRLAGQLRYMDSRPDEQQRGITMKSSAIALLYTPPATSQPTTTKIVENDVGQSSASTGHAASVIGDDASGDANLVEGSRCDVSESVSVPVSESVSVPVSVPVSESVSVPVIESVSESDSELWPSNSPTGAASVAGPKCDSGVHSRVKMGGSDKGTRLINLIDSPGHVDFTAEVCSAVCLSDGAVVIVDVIEGVCAQTVLLLRQAWYSGLRLTLVLNKLDRLVLEKVMTPLDAYIYLVQLLETVNAVMAELCTSSYVDDTSSSTLSACAHSSSTPSCPSMLQQRQQTQDVGHAHSQADGMATTLDVSQWSLGLEHMDESHVYFSPAVGNVLFASAAHGWGFCVAQFADIYSQRLGMRRDSLLHSLWGDFYYSARRKRVLRGALAHARQPLFVQLVLANLWAVYDAVAVRRCPDAIRRVIDSLSLRVSDRDLRRSCEVRVQLRAVLGQWLPLAPACLQMIVEQLPPAGQLSPRRAQRLLMTSMPIGTQWTALPEATRQLLDALTACSDGERAPLVVFVSKMFSVRGADLPHRRTRPLTDVEIAARRADARRRHAEMLVAAAASDTPVADAAAGVPLSQSSKTTEPPDAKSNVAVSSVAGAADSAGDDSGSDSANDDDELEFIAFGRVLSGCLRAGASVYVLDGRHDPSLTSAGNETTPPAPRRCTVGSLYLLMGRSLETLARAPAGSLVGIGGLQRHVLRSAALSDTLACPAFSDYTGCGSGGVGRPIVRVAVEPRRPRHWARVAAGLRLLHQADPGVHVHVSHTGEHVLSAAGEVHLQRCLDDLRRRFARCQLTVSPPAVPFRETVVAHSTSSLAEEKRSGFGVVGDAVTVELVGGGRVVLSIRALPLPAVVVKLLDEQGGSLAALARSQQQTNLSRGNPTDSACVGFTDSQSTVSVSDSRQASDSPPCDVIEKSEVESNEKASVLAYGELTDGYCEQLPIVSAVAAAAVSNVDNARLLCQRVANLINQQCSDKHPQQQSVCEPANANECRWNGTQVRASDVWAAGPRLCGPNLLLNSCATAASHATRTDHDSERTTDASNSQPTEWRCVIDSIIHGFQLATAGGPLCDEPVRGVAFVVERLDVIGSASPSVGGGIDGRLISAARRACRQAMLCRSAGVGPRLMAAMYRCDAQTTAAALGRLYGVLARRNGRVLSADRSQTADCFAVTAHLPVVESFHLADELRTQTSGLAAVPQLTFSHWETVEGDPLCSVATTTRSMSAACVLSGAAETEDGTEAEDGTEGRARRYMNAVRQRKGLPVDEQVVVHAEKQRTLARKK